MKNLEPLFNGDGMLWLQALPKYQQLLAQELLEKCGSPETSAEKWVAASPQDTFPFGGTPGPKLYLSKLTEELEAFLCGDPKYDADRGKLAMEAKPTHTLVVSFIAVTIAPAIGASAPIIAPVVALLMITLGKMGVSAWCELRKESRGA